MDWNQNTKTGPTMKLTFKFLLKKFSSLRSSFFLGLQKTYYPENTVTVFQGWIVGWLAARYVQIFWTIIFSVH